MPDRRLYIHSTSGLPSLGHLAMRTSARHYPERALLMARPGELVCVPGPVDLDHVAWLNELGVGPLPEDVLVAASAGEESSGLSFVARVRLDHRLLTRIAARVPVGGALELHPYAVSHEIVQLAGALEAAGVARVRVRGGAPAASLVADGKHTMRARAIELGIPVAEGEVVELQVAGGRRRHDFEPVRAAIQRQLRRGPRVIVRGSFGSGGGSVFLVGPGACDTDDVIRQLGAGTDNRVYLVEQYVDATLSPNLHFRVEADGGLSPIRASDQRWARPLVHSGNIFPSAARCLDAMQTWARGLAASLHGDGFAGELGIDFVEHRDARTGAPRAFLAEVNPRINGAGYPLALYGRLNEIREAEGRAPLGGFASGTLDGRMERFDELREALGDLLFTHERDAGVVPYVLGWLPLGYCGVVAVGPTREAALAIHAEARAALEAAWAAQ